MVELEGPDHGLGIRPGGETARDDDVEGSDDADTGERVVVEDLLPAHGLRPPLTASDHDRYAYVIEGWLGAFIGHTVTAGPGSIVSIPRGAAASMWNALPRDCPRTDLVIATASAEGPPMPLAVEPAACGPDTRIAVLHVWEGAIPGSRLVLTAT